MAYIERNIESKINDLLDMLPLVVTLGSRQSGKTTLAKKIRKNWSYFDLESLAGRSATVELGTFKANELHKKPLTRVFNLFATANMQVEQLLDLNPSITSKELQESFFGVKVGEE